MRNSARWSVVTFSVVLLAACSDNPNAVKSWPLKASLLVSPPGTLDQHVLEVLALYPKGLETAATARWGNVKSKYAAGLSDPTQMVVAKSMLAELTDWLTKKTSDMATPPNDETKSAATARAVLYMSLYVYNGPLTSAPPYRPSADAVTGLVTPGAPATIVTPTLHAGVQFEAGSVDETTIIVITQNPTPYPDNCSGPLQTRLCQYPQFYSFEEFPHKTLRKAAKFNVCHINDGMNRLPLADHDRFRLAHSKPANPADYTIGGTIRNQDGESIEILPLIEQTFSTCAHNEYTGASVAMGSTTALSRLAHSIKKFLTPRTAYAIDLGLGGLSRSFSPFNDVDPLGVPDREVRTFTVTPACAGEGCTAISGGHVAVSYAVTNLGTASATAGQAEIRMLSLPQNADPTVPVDVGLGFVDIGPLVPGQTVSETGIDFVIPAGIAPGQYRVRIALRTDTTFPEPASTAGNNAREVQVEVGSSTSPSLVRVCATNSPDGPVTVSTLQGALELVAPGGTVRICAGTYSIFDVGLNDKSLTIEGEGPGLPTLDAGDHNGVFYMDSPVPISVAVTLRNLRLVNGRYGNVAVNNNYGQLTVDGVEFHPPHGVPDASGLAYLSGLGVFRATGHGVRVQNSAFIGGDIGLHEFISDNVSAQNNTFRGQLTSAIHGNGGSLVAADNSISDCQPLWCIGLFDGDGAGRYELIRNTITVDIAKRTVAAIQANGANIDVDANVINGTGGLRTPTDPDTWPMRRAVSINGGTFAAVMNSHVSGAHTALDFNSVPSGIAQNNTVNSVSVALNLVSVGAFSAVFNDFVNFATPLVIVSSPNALAQCNWWGSVTGPGTTAGVAPSVYTPWARAPIANQQVQSCAP